MLPVVPAKIARLITSALWRVQQCVNNALVTRPLRKRDPKPALVIMFFSMLYVFCKKVVINSYIGRLDHISQFVDRNAHRMKKMVLCASCSLAVVIRGGKSMRNLATIFDKKSYKKFALPYPHNAYPADLLPLWSLSTPHPGQCCFVGGQKWSSRTSTFFFPGEGGGGVLKVVNICIYELSFIQKLDMAKSIFLNIFVQDCRSKFQGELKHKSLQLL